MKANGKVAKRYARALFELCGPNDFDSVLQGVQNITKALRESKELSAALTNPAISLHERTAIVQDIAKIAAPEAVVGTFLTCVLENGRLTTLSQIAQILAQLIDAYKKVKSLEVTSAAPIGGDEQHAILSQVQKDFGADARIAWNVDPAIIGGLRVKAGDVLLDGSISSRLEQLRSALLQ